MLVCMCLAASVELGMAVSVLVCMCLTPSVELGMAVC